MTTPNEMTQKFSVRDATGTHDVEISLMDYQIAAKKGLSLSQYFSNKFPTPAVDDRGNPHATAFEQFCAHAGIRVRADTARGIPASNMDEIINGIQTSAGPIVRNDGLDRHSVAGRLLYPEVMMQLINAELTTSKEDYLQPWENAIALRTNVTQSRVDQPTITVTAPEASAAQPIGQLALPTTMVSITLGSRQYSIPTKSIGIEIADEALQATTIDRLGITLAAQARGERIRRIEEDMAAIIGGDVDRGITAISATNASTYDALVTGSVDMTKKAIVKWLRENYQKMTVTHCLMDIDSALLWDSTLMNTTLLTDQSKINVGYSFENLGLPTPKIIIVPTSIVGAMTVIGFDQKFALHEITNVSASYSAVEQFVMRRATAMRFDFGVALFKLQNEAFTGVVMNA